MLIKKAPFCCLRFFKSLICLCWRPYRSSCHHKKACEPPAGPRPRLWFWVCTRRRPCREKHRGGCDRVNVVSPPHPGPNGDPDIKGRWSETMKLQVRCQLPFETKHSPNPGKTWLVPGIRTNKEEPRAEWTRGGRGGFPGCVDNPASE